MKPSEPTRANEARGSGETERVVKIHEHGPSESMARFVSNALLKRLEFQTKERKERKGEVERPLRPLPSARPLKGKEGGQS